MNIYNDTAIIINIYMNTLPLKLTINAVLVAEPLRFKLQLNDIVLYNSQIKTQKTTIEVDIPDATEHTILDLKLTMSGKTDSHTITENNVEKSALLIFEYLSIDNLALITDCISSTELNNRMRYVHNCNGDSDVAVSEEFTICMGCNGEQTINMYTPLYLCMYELM